MTQTLITRPSARTLDNLEKLILTVLFAWFSYRMLDSVKVNPFNILFLLSEAAVVAFALMRRSTDSISIKPMDWMVGFSGTLLPLMMIPTATGHPAGVAPLLAGGVISIGAKLSLRRSFGVVAANRGVKRTGLYAAVRHPMYLGYFVSYTGALILNPSWINAGLLSLWAGLQLARIRAEERILMLDPAYQAHAKAVRYRLVPLVY